MDGAGKVAAAIVFAALLVVGYLEFSRVRDAGEARAALRELSASSAEQVRQVQLGQAAAGKRAARSASDDLRRRALAPDQQCVGGVVVRVEGTTYTQLGTIANPVRCSGRHADQPLR